MVSEDEGLTIGFDACHALAIKRTPSTLPFLASNGEITTTDNAGLLACRARALDFLSVPGIELELTHRAISFDELYGNNAVASIEDELLNAGGFVHEELSPAKERE